jgi:hypothetical protein
MHRIQVPLLPQLQQLLQQSTPSTFLSIPTHQRRQQRCSRLPAALQPNRPFLKTARRAAKLSCSSTLAAQGR